MFKLFKKKTEVDKLHEQHEKLMSAAYKLSTTDRKASDQKYAEASALMDKIEQLQKR